MLSFKRRSNVLQHIKLPIWLYCSSCSQTYHTTIYSIHRYSHSQTRNAHKLKQTQRFMLSQELQEFAEHLRPKGNVSSLSEGRLRTRGYVSTARGPITTTQRHAHTRSIVTCSLPLARHKTWHSMMPMGKFRTLRR